LVSQSAPLTIRAKPKTRRKMSKIIFVVIVSL
jgi:hypothetical protein